MTTLERLKFLWRTLRKVGGEELPETGRSSVDQRNAQVGSFLNQYAGELATAILEALPTLENLSLCDADFSHAVSNNVKLANGGHSITIEAATTAKVEAAHKILNDTAKRIYQNAAGVDGLINALLRQLSVFGALSSEDVVDFARRQIANVVIVPVRDIRFRAIDGHWQPHQQPRNVLVAGQQAVNWIPLNPVTYRYFALNTIEDCPYGLPPKLAAVEALTGPLADMSANVGAIAKKLSLLGLVLVKVARLRQKPNETDNEWYARIQTHIGKIAKALDNKMGDGLIVHSDDQQFAHQDVAGNVRGWGEVWNTMLERGVSGMDTHPVFLGRPNASTETYADVVFYFDEATAMNMQRPVKRRMEATYSLELLLKGLEVNALSFTFNRSHTLNKLREMQAKEIEQRLLLEQEARGIIDLDQAARALGYEKAVGAKPQGKAEQATFRFDQFSQSYRYEPTVVTLAKKKMTEAEINALIDQFIAQYLSVMQPYGDEARDLAISKIRSFLAQSSVDDFASADDFAEQLFEQVKTAYQGTFESPAAVAAVKQTTKAIYSYYRLTDRTIFGEEDSPIKLRFGGPDTRSVEFLGKFDNYYFSKFADNSQPQLVNFFREQYLENGAAIFGNKSPEELDAFRQAAGGRLKNLNDVAIDRIIQSSVQRISNYAKLNSLRQAEFDYAEIVEYDDGKCTTGICPMLNGKRFKVKTAAETVDKLVAMEPGEYAHKLYESEEARTYQRNPLDYYKDQIGDDGVIDDGIVKHGRGLPPQHVKCRGRIKGVVNL